jgi:hypothetical protein
MSNEIKNLANGTGGRKAAWPTASTRVRPEDLRLIDAAAYRLGVKRGELIRDAVMDRVRGILGIDA